jgi:hypothetical protein
MYVLVPVTVFGAADDDDDDHYKKSTHFIFHGFFIESWNSCFPFGIVER